MAIGGERRENNSGEFGKKVGLFEARVIAINPTAEEYDNVLGIELKEDSKATEYLGESKDGNTYLRVDVWLEAVKTQDKFKASFFLENKERENKDLTKKQYINSVGTCSWADTPDNLPKWFTGTEEGPRDYRVAFVGEEDLYHFLQTWLGKLDYRSASTVLQLDWKKLMNGNVREIREQIDSELTSNIVALATVITKEHDEGVNEYQGIYNKGFLPAFTLKHFRLIDYSDENTIANLKAKESKKLKAHERFVLNVTGEYGCKDFYLLRELKEYNPEENVMSSNEPIADDSAEY